MNLKDEIIRRSGIPAANITVISIPAVKKVPGLIPATARGKRVKNLGWLLRHWQEVTSFTIKAHPPVDEDGFTPDCVLIAHLNDGGEYKTGFSSAEVLHGWLDRPVFRGVPQDWKIPLE